MSRFTIIQLVVASLLILFFAAVSIFFIGGEGTQLTLMCHKEDAHPMPVVRKISIASLTLLHKYLKRMHTTATRANQLGMTTWSAFFRPYLHRKLLS
jgi:hypothetical protein